MNGTSITKRYNSKQNNYSIIICILYKSILKLLVYEILRLQNSISEHNF